MSDLQVTLLGLDKVIEAFTVPAYILVGCCALDSLVNIIRMAIDLKRRDKDGMA